MPIIKRNLNPLCYLAGLDLADQVSHRSAFKIYLNSFRYVVLVLLLVGIPIPLTGRASSVTDTPASHQRMLTLLKQIADQTAETNNYIGEGMALQLRRHLAQPTG